MYVFVTSMANIQVGFPGLMSCVDFDMEQSSRFVGLCGILSFLCFVCVCVSHVDFKMEPFFVGI